jgi:hypothetical protein
MMKRLTATAAALAASLALATPALAANDPTPGGANPPTSCGMGPYNPYIAQTSGMGNYWHDVLRYSSPYGSLGQAMQSFHDLFDPAYCGAAVAGQG